MPPTHGPTFRKVLIYHLDPKVGVGEPRSRWKSRQCCVDTVCTPSVRDRFQIYMLFIFCCDEGHLVVNEPVFVVPYGERLEGLNTVDVYSPLVVMSAAFVFYSGKSS